MYQLVNTSKNDKTLDLEVKLDDNIWQTEIEKNIADAAKNVSIPGFRKGKVPFDKAIEYVNHAVIYEKVANRILNKIFNMVSNEEVILNDKDLINVMPDVEIKNISKNTISFIFKFILLPKIELPDYKNIANVKKSKLISEDEVNKQIKLLMKNDAEIITKENQIVDDTDVVIIDFKGKVDNKELESATANDYELEIGSNTFIPGFESALIGMKTNETKTINLTFPEDYHVDEMKNKPVEFEVTIKNVKHIKYPELNDEYVVNNLKQKFEEEIETVQQLHDFLKKKLEKKIIQNNRTENLVVIRKYLVDNTKYDYIPEKMVDEQYKRILDQYNGQLKEYKIEYKQMLEMQNKTEDEFNKEVKQEAENNAKYSIAIKKIANIENIECNDQDLENKLSEILFDFGSNINEETKKLVTERFNEQKNFFKTTILSDKVLDLLISLNQK